MSEMEWRPIETAPKAFVGPWEHYTGGSIRVWASDLLAYATSPQTPKHLREHPTHWMPLPAPPSPTPTP